jgi:hypothetical protein
MAGIIDDRADCPRAKARGRPHAAILRTVSSTRAVTPRLGVLSLLLAALWLAAPPAAAAPAPPELPGTAPAAPQRPRVGLVLSGGGAAGAAHVGVLKVLEDMHVPIDAIAGTSMERGGGRPVRQRSQRAASDRGS